MAVQKFCADRMFDGVKFLEKDTVVIINENGVLIDLLPLQEAGAGVQKLSGILLPGLINAHCHLELSHFKQLIPPGGGLVKFLLAVVNKRKEPWKSTFIQESIQAALGEMKANGIVGVGDICNTTDAIAAKKAASFAWYNLVEVLNFSDASFEGRWAHNRKVLEMHLAEGLTSSMLTPHASYSVSPATFIALNAATKGKVISVHNQETPAEDQLFAYGGGDFLQLYELTGTAPLGPSGKRSLQTWLSFFTNGQTVLLVHNTYTAQEDIQFAREHAARYGLKLVFCLCPGANKFIEDTLPPLPLFLAEGCTLVLGTDSYSSNWQLSIAAEIKLLAESFPQVPLEVLLQAATNNGAQAFGWEQLGRLAKGARPGLVLLHTDEGERLTGTAERVDDR